MGSWKRVVPTQDIPIYVVLHDSVRIIRTEYTVRWGREVDVLESQTDLRNFDIGGQMDTFVPARFPVNEAVGQQTIFYLRFGDYIGAIDAVHA